MKQEILNSRNVKAILELFEKHNKPLEIVVADYNINNHKRNYKVRYNEQEEIFSTLKEIKTYLIDRIENGK